MAKSTTKSRNLKHFPAPEAPAPDENAQATAVLDAPAEPETPFDAPAAAPPEKPYKKPKTLTFFQRVASIDRADWGDRAKIKVYRLAPLINRLVGSEHKFVTIYGEPITEEKLKIDHGSGRYRLYLNFKAPQTKDEKELDMVELDILDPSFPPRIPAGEWLDDPRNKQWAWAKPAGAGQPAAAQQQPADTMLTAFDAFLNIQDRVQERLTPAEPAQPATQTPAPVDPWSAAEKILNMRADNPMMAILQQQMKDSAAAQEAERQRAFEAAEKAREREFKLQQQLMEAKNAPQKGILEQLTELAAMGDKLEPLKKMFGFGGATEPVGRAARTTALDVVREIASSPFGANLGQGLGMLVTSLATSPTINGTPRPAPAPVVLNPQQSNGTVPPAEDTETRIQRIGQMITQPMLYEFFLKDEAGDTFAERMFDMWPEDYVFMRKLGAENIVNRYRQFGPAWQVIGPKEPAFVEFITEFCNWPGPDESGEPESGIVDLEAKEQGA